MLSYSGERTTGNLAAGRDVMPAYGSLGTVERTYVTANVTRRFTYELSARSIWDITLTNRRGPVGRNAFQL